MALLLNEAQQVQRRVRGREKRSITLNTKLTRSEFAEVERYCEARGFGFGEWLRDLVLREIRNTQGSSLALMGEITAIRLLLVNALEPLLRGEKMTPEQFKEMLRYVKTNKRKAAADMLASYAEGTTEQP
jgi:GAF domain-containing protein